MTATLTTPQKLSGEEFLQLYGDQSGFELDEGRLVELDMPGLLHGEVCGNAYHLIREFVKPRKLGRVFTNDCHIRTKSTPDSYRGADVLYISYESYAADLPTPKGMFTPPLELVIEVKSPSDSFSKMTDKATEYLNAGVKVVLVLDPETESAGVFRGNEFPMRFHNGDEFTLPDILPGFALPVKRFFES